MSMIGNLFECQFNCLFRNKIESNFCSIHVQKIGSWCDESTKSKGTSIEFCFMMKEQIFASHEIFMQHITMNSLRLFVSLSAYVLNLFFLSFILPSSPVFKSVLWSILLLFSISTWITWIIRHFLFPGALNMSNGSTQVDFKECESLFQDDAFLDLHFISWSKRGEGSKGCKNFFPLVTFYKY